MVSQALAAAKPGTPARRNVIASLQNLSTARASRHYRRPAPGL
jgi:hypothetical protein